MGRGGAPGGGPGGRGGGGGGGFPAEAPSVGANISSASFARGRLPDGFCGESNIDVVNVKFLMSNAKSMPND